MRFGTAHACAALAALAVAGQARAMAAPLAGPSDLALLQAAYAGSTASTGFSRDAGLAHVPGQGLVSWRTGQPVTISAPGARFVDTLRISSATLEPNALALTRPRGERPAAGQDAFELTFIRNWPGAVSLNAGRLDLDLTPHAGFGVTSAGTQLAEFGALLRLGARLQDRVLHAVGAEGAFDGSRLFLYASATRQNFGLNLLNKQALDGRANPRGDGSVREHEAGLGLKRGPVSATFGYSHERVRIRTAGPDRRDDNRVGLTLSITPRL